MNSFTDRSLWRAAALVLALVALGCGPERNKISGSAREEYDLRFDSVRAEWLVDDFVVRYLIGAGRGASEPVRVTVGRARIEAGGEIPAELVRLEHFVARRNPDGTVTEEPPFPRVESGWVRPDQVGASPGDPARGSFSFHFEGGRTLGGAFDVAITAP